MGAGKGAACAREAMKMANTDRRLVPALAAAAFLAAATTAAHADAVEDFYRGKTVTLLIGYEVGGGYDLYGRALGRFIGRHIPGNPQVIASNMPGAASMTLANHLAKIAPRDGTVLGAVNSALLLDTLIAGDASKAQFKASDMTMIGSISSNASVLLASAAAGVTNGADIRAKGIVVGTTALSSDSYLSALALKKALRLDAMKLIAGYPGTRELTLALDRGEVGGRIWDMESMGSQKPEWRTSGAVNILYELAPRHMPEIPAGVRLARDDATDDLDRAALDIIFSNAMAFRPYLAPPGLAPAMRDALRRAFSDTMKDPEFLDHMKRISLGVTPMTGEALQAMIATLYGADRAVVERVRYLTTP